MQASGTLVQTGDTASFAQRFYSTLPDTLNNTFRMNIGQMPEDATVADRAFNVTQAANAHGGCAGGSIQSVCGLGLRCCV